MNPQIRTILVLGAMLFLSGCAELVSAMATVSQGAQWISSALDVAESGSDAYFARHPHPEREPKIDDAMRHARQSVSALNAILSAGDSAAAKDVDKAKGAALEAYGELRGLLLELGVLEARPPEGGAETEAPIPKPFTLPTSDDIAARL